MPKLPTYLLILTTAFLLSGCSWFKKPVTSDQQQVTQLSPTPTPPETQLPPGERPIITMKPDAKIQNIELKITNLPADVTTVDYELVYDTGDLQRGVIGTYYVTKGKATILLGSCSSGTCKYDKNVANGQLTIKYKTNGQRILLREPLTISSG